MNCTSPTLLAHMLHAVDITRLTLDAEVSKLLLPTLATKNKTGDYYIG